MKLRLSTLLLVLVLLVTACVAPAAPAGDAAPAASDAAPAAAAGGGEMHTAWPYAKAPNGHFNTFVTDGYAMEIYHWFLEPALYMYMWSDQSWMPFAGKRTSGLGIGGFAYTMCDMSDEKLIVIKT